MRRFHSLVLFCAAFLCAPLAPAASITIDTVHVGNPGNAADPTTGYGAVSYEYRIGTYEVTNAQYAAFLNEKAKSDPLGLYNTSMESHSVGGIRRLGSPGNYSYVVKANYGDRPVNFVSWFDAIRFTNWLHNGQGNGSTETGAYTISNPSPIPGNATTITRNPDAKWWLPSEDEWYKSAYYDPTLNSGAGGYWTYATQSDVLPTVATPSFMGNIGNPGENVANYLAGIGNVTNVGSAGPLSESYYGTSDQTGNVWEWNDDQLGNTRVARGGSLASPVENIHSSMRYIQNLPQELYNTGFRVATIVIPEPSSYAMALCALAGMGLLARRRR